jgi:hypothetical protein
MREERGSASALSLLQLLEREQLRLLAAALGSCWLAAHSL